MDNRSIINPYIAGVFWFVLSLFVSAFNDIITKHIHTHLLSFEIVFFRFLFSTVTLLPFVLYRTKVMRTNIMRTDNILIQVLRGILLFLGISFWNYGISIESVTTATLISFTIPLFILLLGVFFLRENVIWQRWLAAIIGFIGIAITLKINGDNFNIKSLIFILAALLFAILDIINKKLIVNESMINMLFYSSLITTIFSIPFSLVYWVTPYASDLILLFVLGVNSNLLLFFILKSFTLVEVTAIAPYRYFELLISSLAAYLVLSEIPGKNILYGALIIIPSTLFLIISEQKTQSN